MDHNPGGRNCSCSPCPLLNTDSTRAAPRDEANVQRAYLHRVDDLSDWHKVCTFLLVVKEGQLKTLSIIAVLIVGALPIWVKAEENTSPADNTRFVETHSRKPVSNVRNPPAGVSDTNDAGTISVDVWSSSQDQQPEERNVKLSSGFALAGLSAASRMQNTERRMEQSIKRGFPLGEFWIRLDFDGIDDSLRVASLSVRNDADRQALQELQSQVDRLRSWSDWLIQQNRELRLADYYISPSKLDNDEQFQGSVSCTNFLLSMMASGKLQDEDRSCR